MANDEALKEKEQGNAAYKSKNFTKAIEHYQKVNKKFKVPLYWHYLLILPIISLVSFYSLFIKVKYK